MHIKAFIKKFKVSRYLWHFCQSLIYFIKHPFPKHNRRNRNGVVVQILTTYSKNDAIGNAVTEYSKELDSRKIENYIVYEGSYSSIKNGVPISNFKFNKADIVIYHMSIGCKSSEIYKHIKVKKKILNYHNITPAKFLNDYPQLKRMSELGKRQLIELKECSDLAVCDSQFNEKELKDIGYKNTCVITIPTRIDELLKYKVDKENDGVKKIITVGRIARNKCIDEIIKVFNEYHKQNVKSKLFIIGRSDNSKYFKEIKKLVADLNLINEIVFTDVLSEIDLAKYYSNADVYLCMSEHEGYCIPIVEALAFGVKVISKNNTALTDTVGKYGILFNSKDYKYIASLIDSDNKNNVYNLANHKINIDWIFNK